MFQINDKRQRLLDIIDNFSAQQIIVAGDFIADEFLYGQTSRVSREAPVLVLEYRDLIRSPGGAANAANNLLDLGCKVTLAGVVGDDPPGLHLLETLAAKGANIRLVQTQSTYDTPIKTRILAGAHHTSRQQIVRVDRVPPNGSAMPIDWRRLAKNLRSANGIILSDYGYGSLSPGHLTVVRAWARKRQIPIVVDSRFRMSNFKRVTSITPNITELEAALGISIGSNADLLRRTGARVLREQKLDSLLVTQGRFGMTLFEGGRAPVHIPAFGSDEVADVTGAGDTVIAVYTLALVSGAVAEDAARIANYAGGLVVMKRGTATVTIPELRAAIQRN
jgi:D-glycero-beta-D-manno-heptose-7-phosphate kinase